MNIAISVQGGPGTSRASGSALRFARAAVAAGHRIHRVFFYQDGVLTGNRLTVPPQEETALLPGWVELAEQHGVELAVCVAAALRRGLVDEAERDRHDLPCASLHPAFTIVGLGQLVEAAVTSDRMITFAG